VGKIDDEDQIVTYRHRAAGYHVPRAWPRRGAETGPSADVEAPLLKKYIHLLLLLFLIVPGALSAEEFSAGSIASFTRYLIGKKEYYRAYVELKRLRSYYPDSITPLTFNVTENHLLFIGKQYATILGKPGVGSAPLFTAADLLFKSDSAIAISDNGKLETLLGSWPSGVDPFFDRCFKKRRLMTYLLERRYSEASEFCSGADFSAYRELIGQARSAFLYEKKPWLSALLGIIPGMGYVYSEEYATGIFAFLLLSADIIMTYFAFQTHNEVIGYFTGVIGGFFYAGSIAGGYFAAQRFNMRLADTNKTSLVNELRLEGDREETFNKLGIGRD
jgi:hypothetical protein